VTSGPPSAPAPAEAVRAVVDDYLDALGRGDETQAVDLALRLVDDGGSAEDVRVSAPRGTPANALTAVLDAFRVELHDFPFARTCLDLGHDALVAGG
jgi:hypothetical protein